MSTSRPEREGTRPPAGAQAETSLESQIEALRELDWFFAQAADIERREVQKVESDDRETVDSAVREIGQEIRNRASRLHEIRKRLVATGYDAPNRWLTLRACGRCSCRGIKYYVGPVPWHYVLKYDRPDLAAIDAVREEISAAILRLEAARDYGAGPSPEPDAQADSIRLEEIDLGILRELNRCGHAVKVIDLGIGLHADKDRISKRLDALDKSGLVAWPMGKNAAGKPYRTRKGATITAKGIAALDRH